jgi:transketolase
VYTHDSIGLGEDGPTHQAVEHTSSLRLIPNLDVWRPGDSTETAAAWVAALERANGPTALILTRQNVAFQPRDAAQLGDMRRGGYVLADWKPGAARRVVIIATGSELALATSARTALAGEGIDARVVSLPCTAVFERQDAAYRASVLPPGIPRVAVEAGATAGWRAYVGAADDPRGAVVGIDTYGESAPAGVLFKHFGFTADVVAAAVKHVAAAK